MRLAFTIAKQIARVALVRPVLKRLKDRAIRLIIGGFLAIVCVSIGLVLLIAGIRTELDLLIGRVWSPIVIGIVFIIFAGLAYVLLIKPRKVDSVTTRTEQALMQQKILRPARQLEHQIAQRPLISVGAAVGTGFAAAILWRFLRRRR